MSHDNMSQHVYNMSHENERNKLESRRNRMGDFESLATKKKVFDW